METDEQLITLTAATKLKWLPRRRNGARPHLSTMLRWVLVGVRGIKLDASRVGHCWCTTERNLRDFFSRLAAPTIAPQRQESRRVAERRAEAYLDEAGIQ